MVVPQIDSRYENAIRASISHPRECTSRCALQHSMAGSRWPFTKARRVIFSFRVRSPQTQKAPDSSTIESRIFSMFSTCSLIRRFHVSVLSTDFSARWNGARSTLSPLSSEAILMRSHGCGICVSRSLHEICKHASAASTKECKSGLWSGLALRASLCIADAAWAGSGVEQLNAGIRGIETGESGSSEDRLCIAAKWPMSPMACISVRAEG